MVDVDRVCLERAHALEQRPERQGEGRQQGDDEWLHFDDTVYGGDFLQHQPPVKEMAYWGPKIIDLMDRLGVTFNRTPEGYLDRRRFGGTLFKRTAFAGATTGIATTTPEGRFLQANPAYCATTGRTEEELRGLDVMTLIHPEDRAAFRTRFGDLIEGKTEHFVIETRCLKKGGGCVWKRASVSALRAGEGPPAGPCPDMIGPPLHRSGGPFHAAGTCLAQPVPDPYVMEPGSPFNPWQDRQKGLWSPLSFQNALELGIELQPPDAVPETER